MYSWKKYITGCILIEWSSLGDRSVFFTYNSEPSKKWGCDSCPLRSLRRSLLSLWCYWGTITGQAHHTPHSPFFGSLKRQIFGKLWCRRTCDSPTNKAIFTLTISFEAKPKIYDWKPYCIGLHKTVVMKILLKIQNSPGYHNEKRGYTHAVRATELPSTVASDCRWFPFSNCLRNKLKRV